MRSIKFGCSLLASVGLIAVAQSAAAQEMAAVQDSSAEIPAADETAVDAVPTDEAIIVTGSRTNGANAPTPVTIVSTEQLLDTNPGNIIDAVQSLPTVLELGPNNASVNPAVRSNARTIDLRGLGSLRTLILFDGQRVPPTTNGGLVSLDLIPSMLLERVDIVTGGASAVYGSDAVAGVVNFVTDRNFNGYKVKGSSGISQQGDASEINLGVAGGTDIFGGKAHIEGSYEYYRNGGIGNTQDREFGRVRWGLTGTGTAANPYILSSNIRTSTVSFFGKINSGPLGDMVFRTNGVLSPFQHGQATGTTGTEIGGDGEWWNFQSLKPAVESHKVFGRFDIDLSENIHFFAQGIGMWTDIQNSFAQVRFSNFSIASDNAFLAPEYQQILSDAGVSSFTFSKALMQAGGVNPSSDLSSLYGIIGLEGDLSGWKWELGYSKARNRERTYLNKNTDREHLLAAMDAVRAPNGDVVCRVTLTHPTLYPGCVPINLFGPTSESAEALAYIATPTGFVATTEQDSAIATINGSPFSTWAGPVQLAVTGEWRKVRFRNDSNVDPNTTVNCTGIRFNCSATTLRYQSFTLADASSSQSVVEGAIEADVPLLSDLPFAQAFNLNGALRRTHYDTSGNVTTWKLGAVWKVNDDITLRVTRSRDIRAPNLDQLFRPQRVGPGTFVDIHTNQLAGQAISIAQGNPDLVPEVAQTWSAGVVLRPSFLPAFSLSVDWYKIRIDNAITDIEGRDPTIQAQCEASNGTSPYCDLIVRPLPFSDRSPANTATATYFRPENSLSLSTNGIDVEANYRTGLFGGDLSLRGVMTYQPDLKTQSAPGFPVLDAAGVPPLAKVRATLFIDYDIGDFSINIQERWRSSYGYVADPTQVVDAPRIPSTAYTNVRFAYNFDESEVFLAVENLFNNKPTPWAGGTTTTPGGAWGYPIGDDVIGRYFTVGFRIKG